MLHIMDVLTDKPGWEEKVCLISRVSPIHLLLWLLNAPGLQR